MSKNNKQTKELNPGSSSIADEDRVKPSKDGLNLDEMMKEGKEKYDQEVTGKDAQYIKNKRHVRKFFEGQKNPHILLIKLVERGIVTVRRASQVSSQ